jgi:hypothetical protein
LDGTSAARCLAAVASGDGCAIYRTSGLPKWLTLKRGLARARERWVIPSVMTLATLADVRELVGHHLPPHFRGKSTWRHVAAELDKAAAGGDTADVSIALRKALTLEGVECRPN